MKKYLVIVIVLISGLSSYAQNDSTAIETYTSFLGYQYIQGETTILMPIEMLEIFQNHPAAFSEMEKARSRRLVSQIFFSVGAVVTGYAIVSGITKQSFVWEVASLGAGLVLVGIPFNRSFHKHTQAATAIFNESISSKKKSASLRLRIDSSGLGVSLRF